MAGQSWLLTDLDERVYVPDLELGPADFTGEQVRGLRIHKHVLRGGLSDGVDVIEIENGACAPRSCPRAAWAFIVSRAAMSNSPGARRSAGRCTRSSSTCSSPAASVG